ncbi:MAG: tRNA 2-selenouridine(34) synthase MnmH [Chitinophagales bacterium]
MITALDAETFFRESRSYATLDVRSEGEYKYGHIPHALNLPLFNNEERAKVGTLYKQQGSKEAILLGLDLVGPKMSGFIRFVADKVKDNKLFVHCWRGGMRSGSMAWLFNQFGYDVYTLKGGYKAYRHMVLNTISAPCKYIVIGGKTGSGKTEVLQQLKQLGEQVIDLEALANHKGSAFGMLGQPAQPSTEHFENLLYEELIQLDRNRRIWIEDESKKIGTVVLDNNLWQQKNRAALMVLEIPLQARIDRLVNDYSANHHQGLEQSITNIKKRLGNLQWKMAIDALHAKDYKQVAEIALYYYDKTYEYGLTQKKEGAIYRMPFDENSSTTDIAEALLAQASKGLQ